MKKLILILLLISTPAWAVPSWKIDDLYTFTLSVNGSAGAVDADSAPSYRIYEDETGTAILTGTLAKLDDAGTTGFYSEQITLSAANGLEKGKSYNIILCAVVSAITSCTTESLQIEAEVDSNTVSPLVGINLDNTSGTLSSTEIPNLDAAISTRATPAQVATELTNIRLDELISVDSDIDGVAPPVNGSIVHELLSKTGTGFTYDQTTDSLEAVADNAPGVIADAVLDEDMTAHQTQGTLGQAIGDPAADTTKMWNIINQMADKLPTNNFMGSGVVGNMDDEINAILVDTAEIGVAGAGLTAIDLPNQIMDITGSLSGAVGSVTGAVGSVTGNVGGNVVGSVASVTNIVTANVTQISGDSIAADNAEAAYDGTGYLGEGIAVTITSVSGSLPYTITITETGIITVDNQFAEGGKKLYCAKEERIIVATDDNTADTITVEPGNPFNATPTGTCYIK